MPNKNFVYKITVIKTGHYYIGVTADFLGRFLQHRKCIEAEIFKNNFIPYHKELGKHLYKRAASIIGNHFDRWTEQNKHIRKSLKIDLMAIISGRKQAEYLEGLYIAEAIKDELCLNKRNPIPEAI